MANLIPFEKLEIGGVYQVQSRYWHKLLEGPYEVIETDLSTGTGRIRNTNDGQEFSIEADWDWFWDRIPSEEERRDQALNFKLYVPPRVVGGRYYSDESEEWTKLLDELSDNLNKTFENNELFKDKNGDTRCVFSEDLDFEVEDLLIKSNGRVDYESAKYVIERANVSIYPAERDSFGWLVGCIEKKIGNSCYKIFFG